MPRSTISRQHNSSPLVHSPQPSGTAETSTLILLVGSLLAPRPSPPPTALSFSLFPYPHPSLSSSPSPESARPPLLSSSCPNFIPGSPFTRARQASSSYTSASRPLCFNNTVYIGTRSIDLFARRPPRVRRAPRWTYRTYIGGGERGDSVVPIRFRIRIGIIQLDTIRNDTLMAVIIKLYYKMLNEDSIV